jgi:hypothetical protein
MRWDRTKRFSQIAASQRIAWRIRPEQGAHRWKPVDFAFSFDRKSPAFTKCLETVDPTPSATSAA